jgi:ariadne-1
MESNDSFDDFADSFEEEEVNGEGGWDFEEDDVKTTNYKCLTPADILTEQTDVIKKIAELFSVPSQTAKLLLINFKWNSDLLTEKFYDNEEKLYSESGIPNPHKKKKLEVIDPNAIFDCSICLEEFKFKEMERIQCGHIFCKTCWKEYLIVTIHGGKVTEIVCPARGCSLQLDEVTISTMLGSNVDLLTKYQKFVANSYVNDHKNIRWCPGKGCNNAVRVSLLREKDVECTCGTRFCFGCGNIQHAPADCHMLSEWNKKASKEGDDSKWMVTYTKECPQCFAIIHKDGGCQYMCCHSCKHKFCWICLGAFDHADHSCNRLKTEKDPNSERAQLNKYVHFMTRYNVHEQSLQLEGKLTSVAQKLMKDLSEKGMSWIDVQFIEASTKTLTETRRMLKFSYIYGYYLPSHVNREIFEYLQSDLESGVERLSALLEATGEKDRFAIINATEYVKQRQKNILSGLLEGDISGGGGKAEAEKFYDSVDVEKYEGWVYKIGP